ncbi:hypothetical protein A3D77_03715 [Candidatus Gottesmanbacteria bacterium RIFCSPHIGHO2_02_FULL_39_11]|uniref:Porin n=1 Tax=Candidatus Gottesmanbacteria bacterium RIFCSPHIGHO2_02_FULL_39_11 TaxID=1798382 RepID=A0A1F5ZX02_9BACT|nr:MAG: hypothetical protein A3D77_03715 [Candidatus Gottesmanbacteria bacterium RIFCSPHIGHO2_02_FULL_39_11]
MNKYIIETIGTFFLVTTVAFTGNPLAIGVILTAMVYMGGYISRGHYNPAVTMAVYTRGKINHREAVKYIFFQILGATLACLTYFLVIGNTFLPKPGAGISILGTALIEIIFTFALSFVVLHVATSPKTKDNQYYGLAIGLTLMAGAFAGGNISGGVYNPAIAVGAILVDMRITSYWLLLILYVASPLIGGVLAGYAYSLTQKE